MLSAVSPRSAILIQTGKPAAGVVSFEVTVVRLISGCWFACRQAIRHTGLKGLGICHEVLARPSGEPAGSDLIAGPGLHCIEGVGRDFFRRQAG